VPVVVVESWSILIVPALLRIEDQSWLFATLSPDTGVPLRELINVRDPPALKKCLRASLLVKETLNSHSIGAVH